ncbi:MAG TPA: cell wall hydrolase [Sphingomicrobium sp.]|nr:cell wall hydrolase [Sphingomicrobium sp.]
MTKHLPQGLRDLRPWKTHPRETLAVGLLGAALLALAGVSGATPALPSFGEAEEVLPVKPLPTQLRNLAPETALAVNAQIPLASGPNPAALPFMLGKASAESRARALECLTSAIYYEAAREPTDGQRAVAQVVLNRVRHPAFPDSVCGVVYEGSTRATGCQFTFTCDGSMAYRPEPALWERARKVAEAALNGFVFAPAGYATHYHANYVVPYWASSLTKTAVQGAHIFYRWPGGWGRPAAFTDRWSAAEGNPAALRLAALNAPRPTLPDQTADATIEKLEEAGAKVIDGKDGRVRLLFTPEARAAVEKVKVVPYVERTAATDNLKFALNGSSPGEAQRPFGRATEGEGASPATPAQPMQPLSAGSGASPQ